MRVEKLIIGQRLRVLRQSLGLTQAQMAAELGVSASYITLIEADQRPASARLLMRLTEVYDLNITELSPSADMVLPHLSGPTLCLGNGESRVANKRPKPEEIVSKLRQVEVLMGKVCPALTPSGGIPRSCLVV